LAIPGFSPMLKFFKGSVSSFCLSKWFSTHYCSSLLCQTIAIVQQHGLCLWVYSYELSPIFWEFHPLLVLSYTNHHWNSDLQVWQPISLVLSFGFDFSPNFSLYLNFICFPIGFPSNFLLLLLMSISTIRWSILTLLVIYSLL
jgi:hypothetical protein